MTPNLSNPDDPVVALFCGSRHWTDVAPIAHDIGRLPKGSIVIEGGAPGADRIARRCARARGLHVATVEALWDFYGNAAGYHRNTAMAVLRPSIAYAYPLGKSRGTRMMMAIAREVGIPVVEWMPDTPFPELA